MRTEPEIVHAVLASLTRIVAADGARLTVLSYDPDRRHVTLCLSNLATGTGPDEATIREFLVEVLASHGIHLGVSLESAALSDAYLSAWRRHDESP